MTRASIIASGIASGIAVLGCGDDPDTQRVVIEVVTASEGRTIVAEVNGRPVLESCVKTQAEAHSIDVAEALQECIDFELLAQEAERRGYSTDPDAVAAQRR